MAPRVWTLALLWLAAGCPSSGGSDTARDCEPAIDRAFQRSSAGSAADSEDRVWTALEPAAVAEVRAMSIERCRTGHWGTPILDCLRGGASIPRCFAQTHDPDQLWEYEVDKILARSGGATKLAIDAATLLAEAFAHTTADSVLHDLAFDYVRSDATMQLVHGNVRLGFGRIVHDDPQRPTGSPLPPPTDEERCPIWRWHAGAWRDESKHYESIGGGRSVLSYGHCARPDGSISMPRCSVAAIWSRALARGAPAAAVAVIKLAPGDTGAQTWDFAIEDLPRHVHVHEVFADDCGAEKPD